MYKKLLAIALVLVSVNLFAHEGHDDAPGSLKANHGGVVKAGKDINLEYKVSGDVVELYPVSHEGQDLTAAEIKVTATGKLPKGKAAPLKLEVKNGVYTAQLDFKGAYRIEVLVTADNKGKISTFKFQAEK